MLVAAVTTGDAYALHAPVAEHRFESVTPRVVTRHVQVTIFDHLRVLVRHAGVLSVRLRDSMVQARDVGVSHERLVAP